MKQYPASQKMTGMVIANLLQFFSTWSFHYFRFYSPKRNPQRCLARHLDQTRWWWLWEGVVHEGDGVFICLGAVGTPFRTQDGRAQSLVLTLRNDLLDSSVVVLRDVGRVDVLLFKFLLEIRAPDLPVCRYASLNPVIPPRSSIFIANTQSLLLCESCRMTCREDHHFVLNNELSGGLDRSGQNETYLWQIKVLRSESHEVPCRRDEHPQLTSSSLWLAIT